MLLEEILERFWRVVVLAKEGGADIELEMDFDDAEADLRAWLNVKDETDDL